MRNKIRINHPLTPALRGASSTLKRRGSISKPLLFKEGLGWLILGCCAIFFFAGFINIGNIDYNNWGIVTPGTSPPPHTTHFSVIYPVTPTVIGTWVDSSSSFSCSGYSEGERINSKNTKTLSIPPGIDTCAYLRGFENGGNFTEEQDREIYDSLRLYVEICGKKDCHVWEAFSSLTAAVQFMSNDTTRFDQYRTWLDSVLYLYPNCPEYFCVCMGSIQRTFQYGKYKGTGTLAVEKYLRKFHPECYGTDSSSIASVNRQYAKDSLSLIQAGMDPTHLPPFDSIGLGFVLQHDANLSVIPTTPTNYLTSFTSSPNPFNKETTLEFTLNRMTYTTIGVYDELGRLIWGDGRGEHTPNPSQEGNMLEAGEHSIHLDATNFPSGTLYARISTGFGEVKTMKLVHEK